MNEQVGGWLVWRKGLRGFICEKWPATFDPPADAAEPVAKYPLSAGEFGMSLLILEQRFAPPPETPEPKAKLEDVA